MQRTTLLALGTLTLAVSVASAQTYQRRATLTGDANSNEGKCTIEVVVDGTAEVTIQGSYATLRNLSGQPPQWRRFECNRVMPSNPTDFRFQGIDGRGSQDLVRSAQGGGPAVVRIQDRDGGAEGYTFDVLWTGGTNYSYGNQGVYNDPVYNDPYGASNTPADTQRLCEDQVFRQASRRFNTQDIRFLDFQLVADRPQRDRFQGAFEVYRGGFGQSEVYRFQCNVNQRNGRVQARIQGRDNSYRNSQYGSADRYGSVGGTNSYAYQSCERAVEDRLRRDGYQSISFGSTGFDTRSTRNDVVVGSARGTARYGAESFDFTCSMNTDGSVRSLDVRRR